MASKFSKFERLQRKYIAKTRPLYTTKEAKEVFDAVANGDNHYLRLDRIESSAMDMSWIQEIEDTITPLGEIVQNPKKTINTLSEVVQVEKARKTTRESVQHLSQHTEFVKSIDEEGNVTPNKILNVYSDDFYAIYENKFIATLIRHLIIFVEKRYEFVSKQAKLQDVELLYAKSKTMVDGCEVEIETKVRYAKPAPDSEQERLRQFLKRIEDIRKYLRFYTYSEFMHILRREKDVRNPILQTNIIRKNPKYRRCYQLWQFINKYEESGLEFKIQENYSELTPKEIEEINKTMFINLVTLKGKDPSVIVETKQKTYKPRILHNYDDEIFRPEPYYESPIEFVRVDEKYRAYKEKIEDLNPHPTKGYAQYNEDEYQQNKLNKEETKQVDSLIARKQREFEKYTKEQEKLEKKEQEEAEIISAMADDLAIKEQEEKLAPYREALKNGGLLDEQQIEQEEAPKEEPVPEPEPVVELTPEPIQEPTPVEETPAIELEPVIEEQPVEPVEEIQPEPASIVEETPIIEEKPVEEPKPKKPKKKATPKKKKKAPAKRKPKKKEEPAPTPVVEPEPAPVIVEEPIVEETPVIEETTPEPIQEPEPIIEEPTPEPEPVVEKPKPSPKQTKSSKAKERKAKREAIQQAKILKIKSSRKKFSKR